MDLGRIQLTEWHIVMIHRRKQLFYLRKPYRLSGRKVLSVPAARDPSRGLLSVWHELFIQLRRERNLPEFHENLPKFHEHKQSDELTNCPQTWDAELVF